MTGEESGADEQSGKNGHCEQQEHGKPGSRDDKELSTGWRGFCAGSAVGVPIPRWTEPGRIRRQERRFLPVILRVGAGAQRSGQNKRVHDFQERIGIVLLPAAASKEHARNSVCTP